MRLDINDLKNHVNHINICLLPTISTFVWHVVMNQAFEQISEEALKLENSYRLRYRCSV